jgi:hypothetical protein
MPKLKKEWSCTSWPPWAFMAGYNGTLPSLYLVHNATSQKSRILKLNFTNPTITTTTTTAATASTTTTTTTTTLLHRMEMLRNYLRFHTS